MTTRASLASAGAAACLYWATAMVAVAQEMSDKEPVSQDVTSSEQSSSENPERAASPTESAQRAERSQALDTIVVTANRRETDVQDVPFSILAFGETQIRNQRLERAEDLFNAVPGALFAPNVKTASYVSIRGLASLEDAPAADLPIAFFVDDVYTAGISDLNLNYFDLERIEVLRGPQGTLFGRNVIGGAVLLVSKRPSFDETFGTRVTLGNDSRIDTEGYLNGVLIPERVAGRLSFSTRMSDGFVQSRYRGERLEDDGMGSMRAQLLFTPADALDFVLASDYTRDRGKGGFINAINFDPVLVPPLDPDPWVVDHDYDTSYSRKLYGHSLRGNLSLDAGTLTSITAYRRNRSSAGRDVDGVPLPIVHSDEEVDNRQFTQEVRFASVEERTFSYVVGAFYLDASNFRVERQQWQGLPDSVLIAVLGGPGVFANDQAQDVDLTSYAGFGEITYRFTGDFAVSLGGRYTRDEKSGHTLITGPLNPIIKNTEEDLFVPFSKSWSAFTPRVVARYEPTNDLNFYATVARGYKGGGFTAGLTTAEGLATPFDPEKSTNYELGAKTRLFDGRMQLNTTVFRQDTDDLQVRTFNSVGVSIVGNAASARVQGLELETTTALTDRLLLTANYAYLDAEYRDFELGAADYTGNRMPYSPVHAVSLGIRTELPLASGATVSLASQYHYRSELELLEANNLPSRVKSETGQNLLDASMEYMSASGRWQFSLWGKNLTDEAVLQAVAEVTSFWATFEELQNGERGFYAVYGRPRSYGVTLSYSFE
jgi:iron complex outermembrane recepter protein